MVRISKSVKGTKLTKGPDSVAKAVAKPDRYCPECDHEFKRPAELRRHLRDTVYHNPTGARQYICDICDRGFTQFDNLANHILYRHYSPRDMHKTYQEEPYFQRITRLRILYGKLPRPPKTESVTSSPTESYSAIPSPLPSPPVQAPYNFAAAIGPLSQTGSTYDGIYVNPVKEPELGLNLLNFSDTNRFNDNTATIAQGFIATAMYNANFDQYFPTQPSASDIYVDGGISSFTNPQLFSMDVAPAGFRPHQTNIDHFWTYGAGSHFSDVYQPTVYNEPIDPTQSALTETFDPMGQQTPVGLSNVSPPCMGSDYGMTYPGQWVRY